MRLSSRHPQGLPARLRGGAGRVIVGSGGAGDAD